MDMSAKSNAPRNRIIIAHHLILMGYGHWLPNEIRGSGSDIIRNELLRALGEIHPGKKRNQSSREELRSFHQQANPLLEHEIVWFDHMLRQIIANAFAVTALQFNYIVVACAILRNHAHLVVLRHKHHHEVMWRTSPKEQRSRFASSRGLISGIGFGGSGRIRSFCIPLTMSLRGLIMWRRIQ
jgi:hypothetical protein